MVKNIFMSLTETFNDKERLSLFMDFLEKENSAENLELLIEIEHFKECNIMSEKASKAKFILNNYIANGSRFEVTYIINNNGSRIKGLYFFRKEKNSSK